LSCAAYSCSGESKQFMPAGTQGRAIFISYRRDDSEGESGRLFDDLVRAYGDDSVFMDVAGIQPGLDFRKAIDDNVATCGVLLAVIGPTWATVTGSDGARRLDNPNDYVRLEIGSALKRGIPVIPVLVHEAHMPALELLPDDLRDLRYRNSVELTHARWNSDVALLVNALKSYVGGAPAHPEETVHATVPVQLPAPQSAPAPASTGKSRMPLFVGLGAVVLIAAVAIGFVVMQHNGGGQQANPDASNTAKTGTAATGTTTPVNTAASTTVPAATTGTPAGAAATPAESPKLPETAAGSAYVWRLSGTGTDRHLEAGWHQWPENRQSGAVERARIRRTIERARLRDVSRQALRLGHSQADDERQLCSLGAAVGAA
jgi:hypothetical protein